MLRLAEEKDCGDLLKVTDGSIEKIIAPYPVILMLRPPVPLA